MSMLCIVLGALLQNVAVPTQHNDARRTGANLEEKTLTPGRVRGDSGWTMRLRTWRPLDGVVNAQALYVPDEEVNGKHHDVIYIETGNNYVDAYDAQNTSNPGTTTGELWHTHLTDPTLKYPLHSSTAPQGTPVIDVKAHTIYLVYGVDNGAFPSNGTGDAGYTAAFHLVALDIRSGKILRDSLIHARVAHAGKGHVEFEPQRQVQRAGLLLSQGSIYVAFASRWREETINWHGWVMRYDAATFQQLGAFCSTPDQTANSNGGGIWEGGGGLPADDSGNVYFLTGNGPYGGTAHGNSIVRLTPSGSGFTVLSFSAANDDPAHAAAWADSDIDLGAGGSVLVPNTSTLIGGGKTGVYYVMNTNGGLTKVESFIAFTNRYQPNLRYHWWNSGPHLHGAPTYWDFSKDSGFIYAWAEKDSLRRYTYHTSTGMLDSLHPLSAPILAHNMLMPGGNTSLSANGSSNGIIWVTHPLEKSMYGQLIAFDALTLQELWSDTVSVVAKFAPPTVTNGLVIAPTGDGELLIYEVTKLAPPGPTPPTPPIPPIPPRYPPIPWYLLPLGDPAPVVESTLGALPPEVATSLQPPAAAQLDVLFTAAIDGTTVVDDIGLRPGAGYEGRGETLATLESAGNQLIVTTARGGQLHAIVVHTAPNGWQLLRVERNNTRELFARVRFISRLGNRIAFWGPLTAPMRSRRVTDAAQSGAGADP